MEQVTSLFEAVRAVLSRTALKDAVVSRPVSAGDQHVVVLSDVSVGLAAGGGSGTEASKRRATGLGGAGGGGARARPVAVLVVENGEVRVEPIGR